MHTQSGPPITDAISNRSLTASLKFCRHPMYRSVVLHRRVTEEKLNLLEFPSSAMAKTGAGAAKIVGRETVNADSLGISFHRVPDYVGCHSCILPSPILRNSSEHLAFSHS